jgi:hypothetical protein
MFGGVRQSETRGTRRGRSQSLRTPILLLLAVFAWLSAVGQESQLKDTGPKTVVISYRCSSTKRAALREQILKSALPRFEKWKTEGVLEQYRLLFNSFVDDDTWDLLAIIAFHEYNDVDRWRKIERSMPGGLTAEELSLASPLSTNSMDLSWWEALPASEQSRVGESVFFVIPYVYSPTSTEDYIKYLDGYVIPQTKGWMREGILSSYEIYLNRYPASQPWQALFVLQYKDWASFGQREKVVTKVRQELRQDPAWKALSDNKLQIRVEKKAVISEQLGLETPNARPPQ